MSPLRKPCLTATVLPPMLQANHPCILQQFQQFAQQSTGRRLVVFMDYDGELLVEPERPAGCQLALHTPHLYCQLTSLGLPAKLLIRACSLLSCRPPHVSVNRSYGSPCPCRYSDAHCQES